MARVGVTFRTIGGRGTSLLVLLLAAGAAPERASLAQTIAAAPPAPADFLSLQPKFAETPQYDSNPTLLPGASKPLFGTVTTPEFVVSSILPDQQLSLDTRVNLNEFNQSLINSTDVHSALRTSFSGQQWQFAFNGNLDRDTTRTSEETASGINIAGISHLGVTLSPQITWSAGPADTVALDGSVASSLYSSPIYTNFRTYSVSPVYQHAFTPLTTGEATVQLSRYQTTTGYRLTIDQLSPMVGFTRSLTPEMTATVLIGLERSYWSYASTPLGPATQTGVAFNADFAYRGQQDVLHLTASRQPNPTGLGTEAETTSVALTNSYAIRPDLQLDLSVQYQSSSYGAVLTSPQRYYANASSQLTYHLTPTIDVSLTYRYRTQAFTNGSPSAASNVVALGFTYTGTPLSLR